MIEFYQFAKKTAGFVVALGAIYGSAWSVGLAPVTNSQANMMIATAVTEAVAAKEKLWKEQIDKIESDSDRLKNDAARIDERTKAIQEELREQRQLQNQILRELRR